MTLKTEIDIGKVAKVLAGEDVSKLIDRPFGLRGSSGWETELAEIIATADILKESV